MHAKGTRLDFRFVNPKPPALATVLEEAGLVADRVEPKTWATRKFAIDIDGVTNAWNNLFHRLLMGNCVLKVESQMGYRQWYYDKLQPYQHYVPIKKDLSDLEQQIDWVLTYDKYAKMIAEAGQRVAQSLTWDSVLEDTAVKMRAFAGS